jgi:hypothetical protein
MRQPRGPPSARPGGVRRFDRQQGRVDGRREQQDLVSPTKHARSGANAPRVVAAAPPNPRRPGWISGEASCPAEPRPGGGTVLANPVRFRVRGPAALLGPGLGRVLTRDSRRDDAGLGRLVEDEVGERVGGEPP